MISDDSNLLVLEDQFRFYDSSLQLTKTTRTEELNSFQIKTVVQITEGFGNIVTYLLALDVENG